ncbi:MAG: flagellar biosynthesis protein FliQ [Candidatus Hydrogenedentota bacterium]
MTVDDVLYVGRDAMLVTLLVASPMLLSGLIIGLVISIFQSVTQIQEITLTFVPKIVVVLTAFVVFLPWTLNLLLEFARPLFGEIHLLVN